MDVDGDMKTSVLSGPIAMDMTTSYTVSYNPPLDLFDFPLSVGDSWTVNTSVNIEGTSTGSVSGLFGGTQPISETLSETVDLSISASCPGTKTVQLPDGTSTTAYRVSLSYDWGEFAEGFPTVPFLAGQEIYYSPDTGYIVGGKVSLADILGGLETAGTSVPGVSGLGAADTFEFSAMSEQEILKAVAEMGRKEKGAGIPLALLVGVVIGVAVLVVVATLAMRRH
jgi:hypothetical protein